MEMICDVPDEVIASVRMGTWLGSSVLEKMVANGVPLPKGHGGKRGTGMQIVSDTLTVTFDSSLDDEAGMCVSRVVNGEVFVLKIELGEQADILYHLLTEQTAKAEIKAESEG